jgi:hypothetical protein
MNSFKQTRKLKFRDYDPIVKRINYCTFGDSETMFTFNQFNNATQSLCENDINGVEIFEGDILRWESGSMTGEHLSSEDLRKANQSMQNWQNEKRDNPEIPDYDWEVNGWKKIYNVGVVVFYNGSFCLHNEFSTANRKKNSKYNGTTYYGGFQLSKNYEIVGNVYRNADMTLGKTII